MLYRTLILLKLFAFTLSPGLTKWLSDANITNINHLK